MSILPPTLLLTRATNLVPLGACITQVPVRKAIKLLLLVAPCLGIGIIVAVQTCVVRLLSPTERLKTLAPFINRVFNLLSV